jgi:hypothetical protein
MCAGVRVDEGDDVAAGRGDALVSRRAEATVRELEQPDVETAGDRSRRVGRAIVADDHFGVGVVERDE